MSRYKLPSSRLSFGGRVPKLGVREDTQQVRSERIARKQANEAQHKRCFICDVKALYRAYAAATGEERGSCRDHVPELMKWRVEVNKPRREREVKP